DEEGGDGAGVGGCALGTGGGGCGATVLVAVFPECGGCGTGGGGGGSATRVCCAGGSGGILRVASSAIVASAAGSGSGITTRISTAPSCNLSRSRRVRGPLSRSPFTSVPLELPKSSTTSSSPRRRSTAWRRDTAPDGMI